MAKQEIINEIQKLEVDSNGFVEMRFFSQYEFSQRFRYIFQKYELEKIVEMKKIQISKTGRGSRRKELLLIFNKDEVINVLNNPIESLYPSGKYHPKHKGVNYLKFKK